MIPIKTTTSTLLCALFAAMFALAAPAASTTGDSFFDQGKQWGMEKIGAETAWQAGLGAGVTVAIVDTGVDLNHMDLAGKFVAGLDYIDGGDPQDAEGHGTHVAGIVAAIKGNGGTVGAAPDAKIMSVRVLDENGACVGACHVNEGIQWAADHGAQVINLSLGDFGQAILGSSASSALNYAWSKGAIPVVSAGNNFILPSGFQNENALVVSATDRNDQKPDFSSGVGSAKWGIAAPGGGDSSDPIENDIISSYFDPSQPAKHNLYAYMAGTSQAAPHVAGAAALLRSKGLTPQQTVDRLLQTAKDIGPSGRDSTFGYGRLDLAKAVEGLGGPGPGPATSSTQNPKPAGTSSSGGGSTGGSGSGTTTGGGSSSSTGSGTGTSANGTEPSSGSATSSGGQTSSTRKGGGPTIVEEVIDPNNQGRAQSQSQGRRDIPATVLFALLGIILGGGLLFTLLSRPR